MILLTGGNGQLGTELRFLLNERKIGYVVTDIFDMNITDEVEVRARFAKVKPDVVFHLAAYTAVDKAEDEGKELAYKVNVEGTRNIAKASKEFGAKLFYISTDYVFDGTLKNREYYPDDLPNPQNEYGRTKYLGEESVMKFLSRYYIIRTSWVFGKYGHNFVFTMQKLAKEVSEIFVVNDQLGRPTWTRTLAKFIMYIAEHKKRVSYGIYHLSNDNTATWYEFAKEILKGTNVKVMPVSSNDFPQNAKRPQYSVMSLKKAKATGFLIPTWQEALEKMRESMQ
ncbi:MAG: dTDP-4-dehydrorhamnose reductase [Streptococcaceae bacterium]|jgi:dTDP-4-dehydrorhamnose reductase|nr:dTDP-4-dehydrorhamnose reductase [Streptococcaceae bacterium]